jgi:hypothetical protein
MQKIYNDEILPVSLTFLVEQYPSEWYREFGATTTLTNYRRSVEQVTG